MGLLMQLSAVRTCSLAVSSMVVKRIGRWDRRDSVMAALSVIVPLCNKFEKLNFFKKIFPNL